MRRSILVHNQSGEGLYYADKLRVERWVADKVAVWIGPKKCQLKVHVSDQQKQFPNLGIHNSNSLVARGTSSVSYGLLLQHDRRIAGEKREQRLATADGFHSEEQWQQRIAYFGWRCRYCGIELTLETITKDHQIALANGGSEWSSNLVPACKSCNSSKGTKDWRVGS